MKYYSAIRKNEIMPYAGTWMGLEIVILSEVSQRQIPYDITIWSPKYVTNELICETASYIHIRTSICITESVSYTLKTNTTL